MQSNQRSLADRIRARSSGHRSRPYWLGVLALAVAGTVLTVLWPARRHRPLLERPTGPRPEYRVLNVSDMSANRVERLNLAVLVRSGLPRETLQSALAWALFSTLDEYNRQKRRRVRVIWAYAVEDTAVPLSRWRALAIWADSTLPKMLQPARSGGDAVAVGPIEYDFTNPTSGAVRASSGDHRR